MQVLGIDIGGSGIKGAIIDVKRGTMVTDRHRIDTPQPSTPEAVAEVISQIAEHFEWRGPIGCTFPGIVKEGVIKLTANVDDSWMDADAQRIFQRATGCPVKVINDADAAGIAEMTFGAGVGHKGVVIVLTFGTGIGSAIFVNGHMMPNVELGHLEVRGKDAEHRAADSIRKAKDWSYKKWSKRVNEFFARLDLLFSPDLLVFGGGVSKKHEKFFHRLESKAEIVPAQLLNNAGIVGAALAAKDLVE